jgi:hypothetical protein
MRFSWAMAFVAGMTILCAQTPAPPEVSRALSDIERLKTLVDAGAVPRADLEKAEAALADANDMAYLRRTLYGSDLTEAEADEMIGIAERRLGRRKDALENARKLVSEGVLSQLSLTAYIEDVDLASKEFDLALSRAKLTRELAEMARLEQAAEEEQAAPTTALKLAERFDGNGAFSASELALLSTEFEFRFRRPLPISALGETAVHRAMGFDHRNRVDVAVHPDQPEGVWLRQYLELKRIPYFAFRRALAGKATGAHIHIGPASTRIARGG